MALHPDFPRSPYGNPRFSAICCAVSISAIGSRIVVDLVAPRTKGSRLIFPSFFAFRNSAVMTSGCASHHLASSLSDLKLGILVLVGIIPLLDRSPAVSRASGGR